MIKNRISLFLATFLVVGFFFLAMPEKGYSQEMGPGCCQYEDVEFYECVEISPGLICPFSNIGPAVDFFPNGICNRSTGLCSNIIPLTKNVPTLSEWGLIIMAGILGIVGFMVIRRRKVTA